MAGDEEAGAPPQVPRSAVPGAGWPSCATPSRAATPTRAARWRATGAATAAWLRRRLGHSFAVTVAATTGELPRGPGGKLEDFVCEAAG